MNDASSSSPRSQFLLLSALTIFLSAFLLFQVQPIISRIILPWFGGGPAIWSTCVLFFQLVLLGGYAYAHYLNGLRSTKYQTWVHVGLLVVAVCTLPITPSDVWKPEDGLRPTWRILVLLLANVGLPYFILSATGPLVQAWFARVYPWWNPYRLYALSNVGSLGALLSYPFLFEPWLTSSRQGLVWSLAFAVFAVLCGSLAVMASRATIADQPDGNPQPAPQPAGAPPSNAPGTSAEEVGDTKPNDPADASSWSATPSIEQRMAWLLLPALASMALLAVTAHLCQDVAVIPFFWVIPLSLYLLSFIVSFDSPRWSRRRVFGLLLGLTAFWICFVMLDDVIEERVNAGITWFNENAGAVEIHYRMDLSGDYFGEMGPWIDWLLQRVNSKWHFELSDFAGEAAAFLSMLFCLCMVCHGELVRCKPPTRFLTEFYMMISAGGALGGIFVGLVCPQLFSFQVEMNITLIAGFMIAMGVLWDDLWQSFLLNNFWKKSAAFILGFAFLLIVVRAQFHAFDSDAIIMKRNFYGVLKVKEEDYGGDDRIRELLNGRILHGSQFLDPLRSRMPTTYYDPQSGVGLALTLMRQSGPLRVAVVGLGTGTLAAYGGQGDYYCFYEINPNVREIATSQFTYLSDSPAEIHIELGDARISMDRQEPQQYDLIALDAFSGDAIPVHLLTKEAFELYYRHLKPKGVIAVHISNRHLDLSPVVKGLADHFQSPLRTVNNDRDEGIADAASEWVLVTRNTDLLSMPALAEASDEVQPDKQVPLWTDQYSNLFQIMD